MKNIIYMTMPSAVPDLICGVYAEGEAVPNDRDDARWTKYLEWLEAGGEPLPYNGAMRWLDGRWQLDDERALELFDQARRDAVDGIKQYIVEQRAVAAGTSDPGELQARIAKRAVAEAVVAKAATEAQMLNLATEAKLRGMGETGEVLAAKIIAKAVALDGVNARLDGLKRAAENALLATTTQEQLDACIERFRAQIAAVVTDAGASE